ncbi:hypothetical protein [Halocatena salina]|uniref:Uncharacterized protein n=1 Tax=Halocatena salina TaxID=2934340 RepID=A0A8U0A876_9EURY|nr:hypothetical protein [Halocatena salina]UPM45036.1 hypothetical protein MW046_18445 [Halocatena salina]
MSDSESPSENEDTEDSSLFGPAGTTLRWIVSATIGGSLTCIGRLKSWSLQNGRQDLFTATLLSLELLGPVWIILGAMQEIGVNKNVLCSSGDPNVLAGPIAGLVELLVFVFVLKGLLRSMIATSRVDEKLTDPLLSIAAAIVPLVIGSVLEVGNESLLECLYP